MFRSFLSLICSLTLLFVASSFAAEPGESPPGSGWTLYITGQTSENAEYYCEQIDAQGKPCFTEYKTTSNGTDFYDVWYISSGADPCSSGSYDPVTDSCPVTPEDCQSPGDPSGSVWNSQSEACECSAGQTDYLATDGSYSCVNDLEECSASTPGFLGYVNNQAVCEYDGGCEEGQSGGVVNGDWICVNEPDCEGTWINGSCISADNPTPNPEGEFENKDTDGDGIPDSSDSDIDGDGIPNGSDDDIDGDGVLNVDDQSNEKDSTASGGNSCDAAPSCSGDAIQCAILQQQWLTRCGTDNSYSESSCSVEPSCSGDALTCESLINEWEYQCSLASSESDAEGYFESAGFKTADDYAAEGGVFGSGDEEDISTVTSSVLSSRSTIVGSCPAPKTVNAAPFGQFEVEFTPFCDLADMIYWVVMMSAYLTATFIIFRSITN